MSFLSLFFALVSFTIHSFCVAMCGGSLSLASSLFLDCSSWTLRVTTDLQSVKFPAASRLLVLKEMDNDNKEKQGT